MNDNPLRQSSFAIIVVVAAFIILGAGIMYLANIHSPVSIPGSATDVLSSTSSTGTTTDAAGGPPAVIPATMIAPSSGPVGTIVVVSLPSGLSVTSTIKVSGLIAAGLKNIRSTDGKTLRFTFPGDLSPDCDPPKACPLFIRHVTPGDYAISLVSGNAVYDVGVFTVTGDSSSL